MTEWKMHWEIHMNKDLVLASFLNTCLSIPFIVGMQDYRQHGFTFTSCFEVPHPLYLFLVQPCEVSIITPTWYRNNENGDKIAVNVY